MSVEPLLPPSPTNITPSLGTARVVLNWYSFVTGFTTHSPPSNFTSVVSYLEGPQKPRASQLPAVARITSVHAFIYLSVHVGSRKASAKGCMVRPRAA